MFAQVKIAILRTLPIPIMSGEIQKPLIGLVKKILAITKANDYLESPEKQARVRAYERKIDHLVYKLYGLTPDEIAVVEGNER